MAIALLEIFFLKDHYKLIRTRDKKIIEDHQKLNTSFVIDVGFQYNPEYFNFDHHQNDKSLVWEDGTAFSSCGLVWKFLKENGYLHKKTTQQKIALLETMLIKNVDKQDNGMGVWNDGVFLNMFNRNHHDDNILDKQFKRALQTGREYIENVIQSTGEKYDFSFSDGGFIVLLNTYLRHIDYTMSFSDNRVSVSFKENEGIKLVEDLKLAFNTMDVSLLWDYLVNTNTLNGHMNTEVSAILKSDFIDQIGHNNVYLAFTSMYQYNTSLSYEVQFKKSLHAISNYYLNLFSKIKNTMKHEKDIVKFINQSKKYDKFVLCTSNIKLAANIIADKTDKLLVVFPRTNNSWIVQSIPHSSAAPFTQRFSMPTSWRGLNEKQLRIASGNDKLIFCHKEGFLCMINGTKSDVINFVENTLLNN